MQATDRRFSAALRAVAVLVGILVGIAGADAQGPSAPRKLIVGDVIVRGNRRIPTQEIQAQIKTRVGGEYSPEQVQDDVRTLMATRQYGNVQARYNPIPDDKVEVYFIVYDYPNTIEDIIFQGAKSIKKSELETLTGLRKGTPLNPIANRSACQRIVNKYNEKGRLFASCRLLEGDKPGDRKVIFEVIEGPEVFIRDIDFTGNKFVSSGVLKTHLISKERFHGLNIFSKPYISPMVEADEDKLRDYYRSFGYHDVRVRREIQWDQDGKTVVLVFHIQEGTQYRVRQVPEVIGAGHFSKDELGRLCLVKSEEFYNQNKVDGDVSRIKDYIGGTGRQAIVQDRVVYTGPGECVVQYEVQERPPAARAAQILIVGNTTTKQSVILHQVPIYPGQPLSYPALREAERNLAKLNLFEVNQETGVRPTVSVIDPDSDTEFKDILVSVQETRTGSLLFGVGFNSDAGATGSIVLNERNFDITRFPTSFSDLFSGNAFRGAGQELRLEAIPGTELQRYTVQFREPYLFDSQFSLSVGGYYYTRRFDEYDERRVGARVGLGRRLNDLWTASATVRVENVDVRNISVFAPTDYTSVAGNNFQVGLRGGLTRDCRDSYLRPTEGNILDVSYEQIVGDRSFPLVNVDFNQYWTVYQRADGSGRHVVAFHSQVGYAGDNTPVYERYFAGGFRSLRGFAFRGVGPDTNGFKVGGDFMVLNSLEYQLPIKATDNLFLVGFVDSGTVERRVEFKDYRVSAGVGVRFVVPLLGPVPIALDFGFPIVKGAQDRDQIFSFWLGFFR